MQDGDRKPAEWAASRRSFLKGVAITVGGIALTSRTTDLFASPSPASPRPASAAGWADQIGLELFTVRDLTAKDYVGTLEKVAAIGYKEIEPAGGYGNMSPKEFRALLDRLGLRVPSTHSGVTYGSPAEMEKQLADFRIMGIEYTELSEPRPAGARGLVLRRTPLTGSGEGRCGPPTADQSLPSRARAALPCLAALRSPRRHGLPLRWLRWNWRTDRRLCYAGSIPRSGKSE